MVRAFFKPDGKKVVVAVLLLVVTGLLGFKLLSVGLRNSLVPVALVLGFPLSLFMSAGGIIGGIIGFFLEVAWLYLLACALVKLARFVKNKASLVRWDARRSVILGAVVVVGLLSYAFFAFGWGDVFVPAADDSRATAAGINEVVRANNEFAMDLYAQLNEEPGENVFFSPWSISTAVAMVYEGARGDTAGEIRGVFGFPEDDATRRSAYARVLNTLNKARGKYELGMANALWLQDGYPFLASYKDTIERYYLGEVRNLDFVNNPGGASADINRWASKHTNHKIREVVSPDMFHDLSRAVLTNAIYFKGKWEHQFDKKDTAPEDFTLASGSSVAVPMMRLTDDEVRLNYTEADGVQVLELPYQGDKVSMLVLLPRTEPPDQETQLWFGPERAEPQLCDMAQLESLLTEEQLKEWREGLVPETVYVYLPKFTFETSYALSDHLRRMGMSLPFTWPGADFSGMDGTDLLYIEEVLHDAYIDVYEEGTEAAAVTTITMAAGAMRPRYVVFRADHPFLFLIQERETGNILFMGKVADPR
ncbi:serpin family protein [Candidatus Woesearchaeota archaeon]|nr:serpin family protein [Candidatus Woesearchaeota archaeon]